MFRLARQERDTWVTWPNRVAALMAAEVALGVEKQTRTPEISEGVEVLFGMGFEHPLQDHGLDDHRRSGLLRKRSLRITDGLD